MTAPEVEAGLGALAPGSTAGVNRTNGSASIVGSLLVAGTTNVLYLNNTNASGTYHVRFVATSATGLAGATTLSLGIQNATASTDQVSVASGALTTTSGTAAVLEPGSVNLIYVTSLVTALLESAVITFDIVVADDPAESSFYVMKGEVTVT